MLNGIVENWTELREQPAGRRRRVHLRDRRRGGGPPDRLALRRRPRRGRAPRLQRAARPLRVRRDVAPTSPSVLVGARKECPLVVGLGDGETFIASAIPAFLAETRSVQLVEDDEIVARHARGHRASSTPDGDADRARGRGGRLGRGGRREGRLRDLHAQGDPRAARRRRRDRRRPRCAGARGAGRHRHLRRGAAGPAPDRDRGLRHLATTPAGRPLRDRGVVAACRWRSTSPPSSATATRCSTSTTW